jgi:multidrug efflux pump subunit AcrA (membrane-fusion protein)
VEITCRVYRPRRARDTPLFRLVEQHLEEFLRVYRRLVFLDRGEGRYEPREVKLGARVGKGFEVLSGLAEGDRVVVSANFLLDSESSLRAALARALP